MSSECGNAQLITKGISPESMTVQQDVDSNISEITWRMVFDGPMDPDSAALHVDAPRIGEKNPFLETKYATSITPRATERTYIVDFVVSYDIMGAPPIQEGAAYEYASRSITREVAAQGVYYRQVYTVDNATKKISTVGDPVKDFENGQIPFTNTADQTFVDPLMTPKADALLTFWILASKKTADQVFDGSIYKFIGRTNEEKMTVCGIKAKKFAITIEDIVPTIYHYYKTGSTQMETRFKVRFDVRIDVNATGYGTGVLSQGRNAKLFAKGATVGDKEPREIYRSDIPGSIAPEGSTADPEIDYDVMLNPDGSIRDIDTDGACYIGNVASKPFKANELPLPGYIGSYATI